MLEYLSMLSPTLNLQVGDVKSIPLVDADRDNIEKMVQDNIDISKEDWEKKKKFNRAKEKIETMQMIEEELYR